MAELTTDIAAASAGGRKRPHYHENGRSSVNIDPTLQSRSSSLTSSSIDVCAHGKEGGGGVHPVRQCCRPECDYGDEVGGARSGSKDEPKPNSKSDDYMVGINVPASYSPPSESILDKIRKSSRSSNFRNALVDHLENANKVTNGEIRGYESAPLVFLETPDFLVLYDLYPKAKIHLILVSKLHFFELNAGQMNSIHDVFTNYGGRAPSALVDKVNKMSILANLIKDKLSQSSLLSDHVNINIGFHSSPSLKQLHLHIISDDFDSVWLKTKAHWLSFTSSTFITLSVVESKLKSSDFSGRNLVTSIENSDSQPITCHRSWCPMGHHFKDMPSLKRHLAQCLFEQQL